MEQGKGEAMRVCRTKKNRGEFVFQIFDDAAVLGNSKNGISEADFSIFAYKKPDGSLYVNGRSISKKHMKKFAKAMLEAIKFSESSI